jgi:hypothetical protein
MHTSSLVRSMIAQFFTSNQFFTRNLVKVGKRLRVSCHAEGREFESRRPRHQDSQGVRLISLTPLFYFQPYFPSAPKN